MSCAVIPLSKSRLPFENCLANVGMSFRPWVTKSFKTDLLKMSDGAAMPNERGTAE